MTIFDTVKGTVNTAVDTISAVAQSIVEKNRTNAKLNRLRLVMKNESELMNRAYIALGKQYYEMQKKGETEVTENQKKLFEVVEKSKAKIAKARECYRSIVDSQNDVFYGSVEKPDYSAGEVIDITVACSNESEYKTSPFESTEESTAEAVENTAEQEEAPVEAELTKADADEEAEEDSESPDGELF